MNPETLPLPLIAVTALVGVAVLAWVWLSISRRRRARRALDHPAVQAEDAAESATALPGSRLERMRGGLARSRSALSGRLAGILRADRPDPDYVERLEEALIASDVGVTSTARLIEALGRLPPGDRTGQAIRLALRDAVGNVLRSAVRDETDALPARPWVILLVGVNGVGKTTTIGKLAVRHRAHGRSVLLVAGDTFRAAAIDQLAVWAERAGCQIVRQAEGTDPGAVVFDGMRAAVARNVDVVLVDTAGRLHTKVNLMEELKKVCRVVAREIPGAPHEVFLVVDATTGQNAVSQARTFHEAVGVTGVILTKLDGSARGGVVIAIRHELGLPVRYVGLGETVADLQPFEPDLFADSLFDLDRQLPESADSAGVRA